MVVTVGGLNFIIDDEDYSTFTSYKWHVSSYDGRHYLRYKSEKIWFHRLIMGVTDSKIMVDHRDMNTLNNSKTNLRICSRGADNSINRPKQRNNTSGYKGVFKRTDGYYKNNPIYRTAIRYQQLLIHLGQYETLELAASVYNFAAKELFGEFALLNNVENLLTEEIKNSILLKIEKFKHIKYDSSTKTIVGL